MVKSSGEIPDFIISFLRKERGKFPFGHPGGHASQGFQRSGEPARQKNSEGNANSHNTQGNQHDLPNHGVEIFLEIHIREANLDKTINEGG